MPRFSSVWVALILGLGLIACKKDQPFSQAEIVQELRNDGYVESNVLRSDYAGSDACMRCHVERHMHWQNSPMRRMTRNSDSAKAATPFDHVFTFKGESVKLFEQDGTRYMAIDSERTGQVTYQVTRLIGGTYREDFAGIPVDSTNLQRTLPDTHDEWILPISYMIETGQFRYKGYSVMVRERPGLHVSAKWNQTCVFCHNTTPGVLRALGGLIDDAPAYQANYPDDRFPEDLQWSFKIRDEERLRAAVMAELKSLDDTAIPASQLETLIAQTAEMSRHKLSSDHFVEVGIGCESCHGGSRQHAEDPDNYLPTFEWRSDAFSYGPKQGTPSRAEQINRACAQCHSVLFSRYMPTWEGGHRRKDPGGSPVNSGEARDFMMGACASQMTCTSCHDPHSRDARDRPGFLRSVAGNGVCTACHTELAGPQAVSAHTHHPADSAGSACLQCHMPEKNLSLNTTLTTYHRIGSPNDPERVERDRPLECALCHVDKSAGELVDTMLDWWPGSFDRDRALALYGTPRANVMERTLQIGRPHEQAVAMHRLADSDHAKKKTMIAQQLKHPYPHVRYHALALLQKMGHEVPVDLHQDLDGIASELDAWLRAHPD